METAGEGGAWGIALLASYMINGGGKTLTGFLNDNVFAGGSVYTLEPSDDDVKGFNAYAERYKNGLAIEKAAVENLK